MNFQTNAYVLRAGLPATVDMACDTMHIFSAIGTLTFKTAHGSEFKGKQNAAFKGIAVADGIKTITSPIDQTVEITYGFGSMGIMPGIDGSYRPYVEVLTLAQLGFNNPLVPGNNFSNIIQPVQGMRALQVLGNLGGGAGGVQLSVQPADLASNYIYPGQPAGSWMDVSANKPFSFGYDSSTQLWRGDQFGIGPQNGNGIHSGAGDLALCLFCPGAGGYVPSQMNLALLSF